MEHHFQNRSPPCTLHQSIDNRPLQPGHDPLERKLSTTEKDVLGSYVTIKPQPASLSESINFGRAEAWEPGLNST